VALSAMTRTRRAAAPDLFWSVSRSERVRLVAALASIASPTAVFCRTPAGASRVADELSRHGVPAASIEDRDFSSERVRVRVLTDDVPLAPAVNHARIVVHFDLAPSPRRYRRRLEQVGAPGAVPVTFVVPERIDEARRLLDRLSLGHQLTAADLDVVRERFREVEPAPDPAPERGRAVARRVRAVVGRARRAVMPRAGSLGRAAIARLRSVTRLLQFRRQPE
jgi:hypothetical protein